MYRLSKHHKDCWLKRKCRGCAHMGCLWMRVGLYIHNKTIKNKFTEGRRSEHESDKENIVTRSHPEQDNDYVLRDRQQTSKGRRFHILSPHPLTQSKHWVRGEVKVCETSFLYYSVYSLVTYGTGTAHESAQYSCTDHNANSKQSCAWRWPVLSSANSDRRCPAV